MMTNPLHKKVSQFLDDDLSQSESLHLLTAMQQQPDLQATMHRYQLINQALRARPVPVADTTFSAQITQKLASEPVYLLPQRRPKSQHYKTAALALAASITAAAIIIPVSMKINTEQTRMALASTEQTYGKLIPAKSAQPLHLYPVNQRFQGYLQAHNGSLYTNGAADLQYRTQLASYDQGE